MVEREGQETYKGEGRPDSAFGETHLNGTTKAGFRIQGRPEIDEVLRADYPRTQDIADIGEVERNEIFGSPNPDFRAPEDRDLADGFSEDPPDPWAAEPINHSPPGLNDSSFASGSSIPAQGTQRTESAGRSREHANTSVIPTVTDGIKVEVTVVVQRSAEDLFRWWRNFENLPKVMAHLESVEVLNTIRSHWIAKTLGDGRVEWDAEIIAESPGEFISWRTVDGNVKHAGSVWFHPAPNQSGTEVRVLLLYEPPVGRVGHFFAKLLGEAPEQQIQEDVRRFREFMESGQDRLSHH